MRVLLLIAGTNRPSNAEHLGLAFAEGMRKSSDTEITTLSLRDLNLEHFTLAHYNPQTPQGEGFETLKKAALNTDGIVIASPIWNFSVPGHLKNAIDRMGEFGLDPETRSLGMLKGKPVFLLYAGGSPSVVWTGLQRRTLSHMPVSLRYFGLSVIGSHYEPRCTLGKGKFELVVDKRPESLAAMQQKGTSFAKIVAYYAKTGKLPFKHLFFKKMFRLGQQMKRKLGL